MPDPIISAGVQAAKSLEKAAASTPGVPVGPELTAEGELSPETAQYLARASGGPIGELWAELGATVRFRRWRRAVRRAGRAAEILRERGRAPQQVPDNVLVPLLEAGSLEEDDVMAERWAALLANATDPEGPDVQPSFPDLLRQLTPLDAYMLECVARLGNDQELTREALRESVFLGTPAQREIGIENLLRLRLLIVGPMVTRFGVSAYDRDGEPMVLGALGQALLEACKSIPSAGWLATKPDTSDGIRTPAQGPASRE